MSIKAFVHAAQRHLDSVTSVPNKRSHIYELIAAACGFGARASMAETVFSEHCLHPANTALAATIRKRAIEIGYDTSGAEQVSVALASLLIEYGVGVVEIPALIGGLAGLDGFPSLTKEGEHHLEVARTESHWPILLDGLRAAAAKGHADAHYALALFYQGEADDDTEVGSAYWFREGQRGRDLTGVEKEWAEAYGADQERREKYAKHLQEAARLGHPDALLGQAEELDDPSFFQQEGRPAQADPRRIAEIAERLGRMDDARHWWTSAAKAGDTDAMRWLAEHDGKVNPFQSWIWVYLAQLEGIDLTKDIASAIHEDGSEYDDDQGGPIYSEILEGVHLPPLNAAQDARARHEAQVLFEQLPDRCTLDEDADEDE